MKSPFPGMDPYLEQPFIFPGFHHSLAVEIKRQLNPQLGSKYFADLEITITIKDGHDGNQYNVIPDTAVMERIPTAPMVDVSPSTITIARPTVQKQILMPAQRKLFSVQIRAVATRELITSVEILSPINKRGRGFREYELKRERILFSHVNLVEVDFLRGGQRPALELDPLEDDKDYVLLVNRADLFQRQSDIWTIGLDEPVPTIPIPLLPSDPDVPLDLNSAIQEVYQSSSYQYRLDYSSPVPSPRLRPEMAAWVAENIR